MSLYPREIIWRVHIQLTGLEVILAMLFLQDLQSVLRDGNRDHYPTNNQGWYGHSKTCPYALAPNFRNPECPVARFIPSNCILHLLLSLYVNFTHFFEPSWPAMMPSWEEIYTGWPGTIQQYSAPFTQNCCGT